jgi:hypothetical protein
VNALDVISDVIRRCLAELTVPGKVGKSLLQPSIAAALRRSGYTADEEDSEQLLRPGMPVWRSKEDGAVVPTQRRRKIDIVVYKDRRVVALVESESDLNDLRRSGVTKRSGHYDVASIARDGGGRYFDSYNSLERMAAAAHYWYSSGVNGAYPSPPEAVATLERIASDCPAQHNPARLPLVLVSGNCRSLDLEVLERRLTSLGAQLICAGT